MFDTSSDWLAIESSSCSNCTGNTYDANESETSEQTNGVNTERKYNEIVVTGTEWTDKVCLSSAVCIEDFGFFLIDSQSAIQETVDGILGLARFVPFVSGDLANVEF